MLDEKKVIFITGFEKNCGKTTFLNHLLSNYSSQDKVGCISVGITSSEDDFLNPNLKPKLHIKKNWRVMTNTVFLNSIDVPFIIEDIIDEDVGGGKPVVIKLLTSSELKLFSPGSNSKIYDTINKFIYISDYVFIDGAFDRITQISSFKNASFFYVFRVEPSNIDSVVERITLFEDFINVSVNQNNYEFMQNITDDIIYHDMFYTKGFFGYEKYSNLPAKIKKIFIMDFTKVFLNCHDWMELRKKYTVFFTSSFKLQGYVINLYDINRKEFETKLPSSALKRIIYNPYEN